MPPNNILATNAIVGKLNEVSKVAEALDIALRDTQNCLELSGGGVGGGGSSSSGNANSNSNSLERKGDGNASIDGRESIDVSRPHGTHIYIYIYIVLPNRINLFLFRRS